MIDSRALRDAQLAPMYAPWPSRMVGGDLPLWSEVGKKHWSFEELTVLENPSYRCMHSKGIHHINSVAISGTCGK
jgi:hypothetical protein